MIDTEDIQALEDEVIRIALADPKNVRTEKQILAALEMFHTMHTTTYKAVLQAIIKNAKAEVAA